MKQNTSNFKRIVLCSLLVSISSTVCADWPQWLGPKRNNISNEKGLLKKWPDDGPKMLWHTDGLGAGYSTVSICDNTIYVTGIKEKSGLQARAGHDKAELTYLRQGHSADQGRSQGQPQQEGCGGYDGEFEHDQEHRGAEHEGRDGYNCRRRQEHADGNEEKAHEYVAQGQDIAEGPLAVR